MSDTARSRIDSALKREAEAVLKEINLTPRAALEMFYSQIVKLRGLPFRPSAFPVLEEYGATMEQAEATADAVIRDFEKERKVGNTFEFKGKL
jgi:addiction module RelB/DinJ family antitoxin